MFNHEPESYRCPFCLVVSGVEGDYPYTKQADIFFKNQLVTAFIASHWWPNNPGHVVIVPNSHVENIYDLPDELSHKIADTAKLVAIAFKETYKCDGVSTRQHNEPDGGQDIWHFHLHVFPRYKNDRLYLNDELKKLSAPEERLPFASKLKAYFLDRKLPKQFPS